MLCVHPSKFSFRFQQRGMLTAPYFSCYSIFKHLYEGCTPAESEVHEDLFPDFGSTFHEGRGNEVQCGKYDIIVNCINCKQYDCETILSRF